MYNYSKFKNKEYDLIHTSGIKTGDKFPNVSVLTLDGNTKLLSEFLDKPIVLETGSISCGMFAGQNKAMNILAKELKDFNFLLLYVREAHPGKLIPAHETINEKCRLANRLFNEDEIDNRTIIVDSIDGSIHQLLGALPNMIFIIDTNRTIIFKEDWNNTKALKKAIGEYKLTQKPLVQKWNMLPLPNIPIEYVVFKRAGWDAAFDFIFALPRLIVSHLIGGIRFKIFNK